MERCGRMIGPTRRSKFERTAPHWSGGRRSVLALAASQAFGFWEDKYGTTAPREQDDLHLASARSACRSRAHAVVMGLYVYGGLFVSALVAATILPAQSELVLAALLRSGEWSTAGLLVAASLGNVLGSVVNYMLGRAAETLGRRRWFSVNPAALDRAEANYRRYGRWSLLLSWVPIVGDPITVVAGLLREPFWSFLVLVGIAKVGRYLLLAMFVLNWI